MDSEKNLALEIIERIVASLVETEGMKAVIEHSLTSGTTMWRGPVIDTNTGEILSETHVINDWRKA